MAYHVALKTLNINLTPADFKRYFGLAGDQILIRACAKRGIALSTTQLDKLRATKNQAFLDNIDSVSVHEPTGTALLVAHDTHHTAIASAGSRHKVEHVLAMLDLTRLIDYIVCAEDVVRKKPDPECHFKIARHFAVRPNQCEIYEDSPAGLEAARAFGAKIIHEVGHDIGEESAA